MQIDLSALIVSLNYEIQLVLSSKRKRSRYSCLIVLAKQWIVTDFSPGEQEQDSWLCYNPSDPHQENHVTRTPAALESISILAMIQNCFIYHPQTFFLITCCNMVIIPVLNGVYFSL